MVSFRLSHDLSTWVARGTQALLSIITLGLAAGVIDKYNNHTPSRASYAVAIAVIDLVYLVVLFVPPVVKFIPVGGVLVAESIFVLFWLIAFALVADVTSGIGNCSSRYYYTSLCHLWKALAAFTFFLFVLHIVTLLILLIFTTHPIVKKAGFGSLFKTSVLAGGLFSASDPVVPPTDPEAAVDPVSSSDHAEVPKESNEGTASNATPPPTIQP